MKDWVIRALKTFVQAFFGVLIPAVCAMLQDGWPESWSKIWVILAPTVAAALAAAICAVWNIILEGLQKPKGTAASVGGGQHLEGSHPDDVCPDPDTPVEPPSYEEIRDEFKN